MTVLEKEELLSTILHQKLRDPGRPRRLATQRIRRKGWQAEKLVILACDHPARRETGGGGNPWAMADRGELLFRIATVLSQPGIDGLLATPDLFDELFLVNEWLKENGQADFLDGKVLIGSMNRGGLAGTSFELDDFVTAYTAEEMEKMGLDGGKLLLRLHPEDRDCARTLAYCYEALNDLADRGLPQFLEPLSIPRNADEMVRLTGVATGLGRTTEGRWLKLPMTAEFDRVARATTCPIVLLGGGKPGATDELVEDVKRCLNAGPHVRGLMIGRGVLFPEDGEKPATVAARLAEAVHEKTSKEVV
ncbi:Cgl0159 family (beta/alpha)8-fold protein [Melghirimyces algeriensis]|uniref:Fructose-bisphosphate aldolase class Ia, DhnA family n=1 Tax=Melghirimyces algeriensis TaxID=910412 RepID=A0A521B3T1_9BACL|nr:hypothetical protein [Melghirimyces algeriensis]SMO41777.1 Fructose-bisphosphate aldolase class Ia, DhnA family [Melghirimyces algeriensis]